MPGAVPVQTAQRPGVFALKEIGAYRRGVLLSVLQYVAGGRAACVCLFVGLLPR